MCWTGEDAVDLGETASKRRDGDFGNAPGNEPYMMILSVVAADACCSVQVMLSRSPAFQLS